MPVSGGIILKKTNLLLAFSLLCLSSSGIYYLQQPSVKIKDTSKVQKEARKEEKKEEKKEIQPLFQLKTEDKTKKRNITSISMKSGFYDLNGSIYFFDDLGMPHTGFINYEGNTYYLIEHQGLAQGFQVIDENTYYFNEDGIMQVGIQTIDNNNYYFDEQGVMQIGFITIDQKTRFFSEAGEKYGFITYQRNTYYVDKDKGMITSFYKIQEDEYYFDNHGVMQVGFQNINDKNYYFNKDGKRQTGWIQVDEYEYYLTNTELFKGLKEIEDNTYYFNDSGQKQIGFQTINDHLYYFDNMGKMITGYMELEDKYYFFNDNGQSQTGFIKEPQRTYYLTEEHLYLTGLQKINEQTYYFDENGSMQIGFQTINNQKYYFKEDGTMMTGTITLDNKKYTFNEQGVLEKEEEIGKTFYKEDGSVLATNAKKIIDVSKFQGDIDWNQVKQSDVDGAILRLGFGSYSLDNKFVQNLNEVKRLQIPYGIYLYSYAVNKEEALSEANFVLNMLKQYDIQPTLGIYYDIESNNITSYLTVIDYEQIIPTFLNQVRTANFKTQVYTYKSYANEKLYSPMIQKEITWIAQYNKECTWDGFYEGWQYTSSGQVPGINGNVDISIFGNFIR